MSGLASSGVLSNPSNGYANFAPYAVYENDGMAMAGISNNCNFNSDGNENDDLYAVRPVASINCGYTINDCIREM